MADFTNVDTPSRAAVMGKKPQKPHFGPGEMNLTDPTTGNAVIYRGPSSASQEELQGILNRPSAPSQGSQVNPQQNFFSPPPTRSNAGDNSGYRQRYGESQPSGMDLVNRQLAQSGLGNHLAAILEQNRLHESMSNAKFSQEERQRNLDLEKSQYLFKQAQQYPGNPMAPHIMEQRGKLLSDPTSYVPVIDKATGKTIPGQYQLRPDLASHLKALDEMMRPKFDMEGTPTQPQQEHQETKVASETQTFPQQPAPFEKTRVMLEHGIPSAAGGIGGAASGNLALKAAEKMGMVSKAIPWAEDAGMLARAGSMAGRGGVWGLAALPVGMAIDEGGKHLAKAIDPQYDNITKENRGLSMATDIAAALTGSAGVNPVFKALARRFGTKTAQKAAQSTAQVATSTTPTTTSTTPSPSSAGQSFSQALPRTSPPLVPQPQSTPSGPPSMSNVPQGVRTTGRFANFKEATDFLISRGYSKQHLANMSTQERLELANVLQ